MATVRQQHQSFALRYLRSRKDSARHSPEAEAKEERIKEDAQQLVTMATHRGSVSDATQRSSEPIDTEILRMH